MNNACILNKRIPGYRLLASTSGCVICRDVKGLNCKKTQGVKISSQWVACKVSYFGDTKEKQQLSLRKKITDHKGSKAHKCAVKIAKEADEGVLAKKVADQQKDLHVTTERIFRTAYKQVKLNHPFSDFEHEIDVQVLNGCNMGRILHSNVACGNIARHIGSEMRQKMCAEIVNNRQKFAILIDESTTLSKLATFIVYIRTSFDKVEPLTVFLDLVELPSQTAPVIVAALLGCLNEHGLSDEYIKEFCVGLATDGASVMLGKKGGVGKLLTDRFPKIILWHCIAHRLELSVHDSLKEVSGTNNFKIFLDKLYSVYSMSPKNQVELRACAAQLDVQLLTIGKMLDTRWVASSVRTVKAVWDSYPALHKHFVTAAQDPLRDAKEKAVYLGLAERLSSRKFVQNLALMYDALEELADLSLEVQRRNITLPVAHRAISRQVLVFEALCEKSGSHLKIVDVILKGDNCGTFKGVTLHNGEKCDVLIRREQFFRSLSNNLKNRMLTLQSSHVSSSDTSSASEYSDLVGIALWIAVRARSLKLSNIDSG
jgi:hypothetical protein